MKNTGSKIVCMLYCSLKKKSLFSIKGRSLNTANTSRNEGVQSQIKFLIDIILSNTRKQNKTLPQDHWNSETYFRNFKNI